MSHTNQTKTYTLNKFYTSIFSFYELQKIYLEDSTRHISNFISSINLVEDRDYHFYIEPLHCKSSDRSILNECPPILLLFNLNQFNRQEYLEQRMKKIRLTKFQLSRAESVSFALNEITKNKTAR